MTEESAKPTAPSADPAPAAAATAASGDARTAARLSPWLLLGLVAIGLFAWQWFETRLRLADTQQELARRLAESDGVAKESRVLAKQAQDQLASLQGKLGELDARLAESQSQQAALENLYQDLARNRDEWALSEIEQSVTLAAQQLQLAGNVQGAVMALQAADARLAASTLPHYIGLRKSFGRDLDRLKAVPQVDLPGMSVRLESVITAIDSLPLAVDVRPRAEPAARTEGEPAAPAWQRMLRDTWDEVKGLVRIQRFDRDEPVLLAPGQVFFLRENLKLRLLSARLAMLGRDQWTFRSELKAAQALLERHFDARDKSVQTAVGALRQLGGAELSIELPTLNESLSAIRSFRATRERETRGGRK